MPKEGGTFNVEIEADPEHAEVMGTLTLQVVDEDGKRNLDYTSTHAESTAVGAGRDR